MIRHYDLTTVRIVMLGCVQFLCVMLLMYPLIRLQVIEKEQYETLSTNNRLVVRMIPARRGQLIDRCGVPLAMNQNGFRVVGMVHNQRELVALMKRLKRFIDLSDVDKVKLARNLKNNPAYLSPLTIKRGLSWEEVARLELNLGELNSVSVVADHIRLYPLGKKAAHLLGYIGSPTQQEEAKLNLPRVLGIEIGKQGMELALESRLHGTEGVEVLELNAKRQVVRALEKRTPVPGEDVRLSLSADLQNYVTGCVQHCKSAAVVVLSIPKGEVLAMVSHPSFDPNIFRNRLTQEVWKSLNENPYNALLNKALDGLYAPGSTIKGPLVLWGLRQSVLNARTRFDCTGSLRLFNHQYHCWMNRWGGHGAVSPWEALVRSCDVFMYQLGLRLGAKELWEALHTFGLGEKYKNSLTDARQGLLPSPGWKQSVVGRPWTQGDTVLMSIGQGYMLATPMELAIMTARLATGLRIEPQYLIHAQAPKLSSLGVASAHLKLVQRALYDVVNHPRGTAFKWRIENSAQAMAGKTGTSQVRRISLAERARGVRKNTDLAWAERDHALYVGYAPYHKPAYAICVVVEHGGSGSKAAAPIGKKILQYAQEKGM